MSIFTAIKGWFTMLLQSRAKEEFDIELIESEQMKSWVNECINIYMGNPCWLDEEDHIDTVNFAKTLCSETARLVMLGGGIHTDGSARAEWLQAQLDRVYPQLRHWVEYGCAYGTVILKPNGNTIDLYTPGSFEVTHQTDGRIDGIVFQAKPEQIGKKWYNRLEYHRFENGLYRIINRCFAGDSKNDIKTAVDIKMTPWANLLEDVTIQNVEKSLFGVLRTPNANNIDLNSPCGLPIFSEAVQELRDLDIAYSRNSKEILDSKRMVMLDSDRLLPYGDRARNPNALGHHNIMPDYIKLVDGDSNIDSDIYHEINPTLSTDTRLKGINALLNQIGYKVGFSNGHFVFNESTGIQTATGVEAEQQRTIQFIKDVRDKLESCLNDLIYAMDVFADLYDLAPTGNYEITYDFADITYSFEEDRAHHYALAVAGHYPWEEYYVRFLRYSRAEAQALLKMAKSEQAAPTLFGE